MNIEDDGHKYTTVDTTSRDLLLYNPDHSLWKRIHLPTPTGSSVPGVIWVAKKLVDMDVDLDIAYSYYESALARNTIQIINEDGSIIKSFPNSGSCYPYKVNGDWKILVSYYGLYKAEIYSVPGKFIPAAIKDAGGAGSAGHADEASMVLYPNPFNTDAILKYSLPAGVHQAKMCILNSMSQLVRTYDITDAFSEIIVNRGDLPTGHYEYQVRDQYQSYGIQKFIIQ